MNICILDNFDSFTFNLRDEFCSSANTISIWRNSMDARVAHEKILAMPKPRLLVLSPGPGHPKDAGCMTDLIASLSGLVPIFGVCLGMQAIVGHFGGEIVGAKAIVHGKSRILIHQGESIFKGLKPRISIGRYHSLAAKDVPSCLKVLGTSDQDVMAVEHQSVPVVGVQFHPESILTTAGSKIINNVIDWAKEYS